MSCSTSNVTPHDPTCLGKGTFSGGELTIVRRFSMGNLSTMVSYVNMASHRFSMRECIVKGIQSPNLLHHFDFNCIDMSTPLQTTVHVSIFVSISSPSPLCLQLHCGSSICAINSIVSSTLQSHCDSSIVSKLQLHCVNSFMSSS